MNKELIIELKSSDLVLNLQDNILYKYNIEFDGYADYLIFKKVDDKIISCSANFEDNNFKFCTITDNSNDIQYTTIDYKLVENNTIDELYEKTLEKYEEFMELYHTREVKDEVIVFKSSVTPDKIKIDDIGEELNKKYYAIEIKETCSDVVYVREKSLDDAINTVEQLRHDGHIVLEYNDWNFDSEVREFNKSSFSTIEKLNDFKNNNLNSNDLTYYQAFKSIYYFNKDATDDEVVSIADSGYDAWMKDEEGYSIIKFTDFLAEHYFEGDLTLEEIGNASSWDIISDSIDGVLYNIKDPDAEMEI